VEILYGNKSKKDVKQSKRLIERIYYSWKYPNEHNYYYYYS
jgi:hypothetical protein